MRSTPDYGERTGSSSSVFGNGIDMVLRQMQDFEYGVMTEGGMADADGADPEGIIVQRPKSFWKYGTGMCHDASVFVDALLTHHHVPHRCYYISSSLPPSYKTHSFIAAECQDGYIRVIDVFSTGKCYYQSKFTSDQNAAKWRFLQWAEEDNMGRPDKARMYSGDRMPSGGIHLYRFIENTESAFTREDVRE